eukprot:TRINITY_DN2306_c0_g2_i1.p1 TRINITY_DN2306_c0_g2~~TRINITY_DN2306_c0_g2_i1.p1  ORF type:complete len:345 (+),score=48.46 TRINITY_DN2306_c0_g2_i1:95-1036(+)
MDGDKMHIPHHDHSDITLNVCLGESFSGGELCFARDPLVANEVVNSLNLGEAAKDLRSSALLSDMLYQALPHKVGQAYIHSGCHLHGARPITKGTRYNLVCWFTLEPTRPFPFLDLPDEIQHTIVRKLSPVDLIAMGMCSHRLQAVCDADDLWQSHLDLLVDEPPEDLYVQKPKGDPFAGKSCKQQFAIRVQTNRRQWSEWFQSRAQQHHMMKRIYYSPQHENWLDRSNVRNAVVELMSSATLPTTSRLLRAPNAALFPGCAQVLNTQAVSSTTQQWMTELNAADPEPSQVLGDDEPRHKPRLPEKKKSCDLM